MIIAFILKIYLILFILNNHFSEESLSTSLILFLYFTQIIPTTTPKTILFTQTQGFFFHNILINQVLIATFRRLFNPVSSSINTSFLLSKLLNSFYPFHIARICDDFLNFLLKLIVYKSHMTVDRTSKEILVVP